MSYKPQTPALMAAPNVIPMADIMLVLRIIRIVPTSPSLRNFGLAGNLFREQADVFDSGGANLISRARST